MKSSSNIINKSKQKNIKQLIALRGKVDIADNYREIRDSDISTQKSVRQ